MRSLRWHRRVAGGLAVVLLAFGLTPAGAQAPSPPPDPFFLGLPEYFSPRADLSFYVDGAANTVEKSFQSAEEALRKCDRQEFDRARESIAFFINTLASWVAQVSPRMAHQPSAQIETALKIWRHDIDQLRRALEKLGRFEDRCPKEKKVGALMDVFLQGGASFAFNNNGFFRALDSNANQQLNQPRRQNDSFGGTSSTTGLFGGGVRVYAVDFGPALFFETRFQTAFGAPSFQQTAGLSGFGALQQQPFGQSLIRENWGIPLLLGTTWSLGNAGRLGELGLDVYGGITIANWTQSLAGGEAGVAGTPSFMAQQTKTSVDPTFGLGLRLPTVDLNGDGRADIVLGVYGELAFRQASSITTMSPSNTGVTYTGSVESRAIGSLMLRLSVPLGGGPLFRTY